ncbi:MAG: heme exporter protein CcmD [Pseudomonadota bacterium]|nr:heme exporter protein CcmD [Pseudomonadota bacterium]MEE3099546.1 heme exporter protein CcmD [Pseudomonadota bacterium]
MPDLGAYAAYVLASYAAAVVVLGAVIAWSIRAALRARTELERLEARHGRRRAAPAPAPETGPETAPEEPMP